jgi:hypothetical protein
MRPLRPGKPIFPVDPQCETHLIQSYTSI